MDTGYVADDTEIELDEGITNQRAEMEFAKIESWQFYIVDFRWPMIDTNRCIFQYINFFEITGKKNQLHLRHSKTKLTNWMCALVAAIYSECIPKTIK